MTNAKLAGAAVLLSLSFGALTGTVTYALGTRSEPTAIIRGLGGVPTVVQRVETRPDGTRIPEPLLDGEYVEVVCTTPSHMKMGSRDVQATEQDKLIAPNIPVVYNMGYSHFISFASQEKGYCWVTTLH